MPHRLKVIVSAYACSPYRGSEHAIGWQLVRYLAHHHDITVLCGDVAADQPTRRDFDAYESQNELPSGLRVVYVRPTPLIKMFERIHRLPFMWSCYYVAYSLWHREALRAAKRIIAKEQVDLVHQLNMIGFREPGLLYQLNRPFVWGPVGGADNEPSQFAKKLGYKNFGMALIRTVLNELQKRICIRPRIAAREARHVWAATPAVKSMFEQHWGRNAELFPDTGATPRESFTPRQPFDAEGRLRVLWSGMHTARKALPILIEALACPELRSRVTVTVLGDGPETRAWQDCAAKNDVAAMLTWKGKLPHSEAVQQFDENDVFVFTSTREATSNVVLESLAAGVPVVCHDSCGMGVVVDDTCGQKIPFKNFHTSVMGFREALVRLLRQPARLSDLSRGADLRAREMAWAAKAAAMSETYRSVCCASAESS